MNPQKSNQTAPKASQQMPFKRPNLSQASSNAINAIASTAPGDSSDSSANLEHGRTHPTPKDFTHTCTLSQAKHYSSGEGIALLLTNITANDKENKYDDT